jgi:glucose uptake protein GlcU
MICVSLSFFSFLLLLLLIIKFYLSFPLLFSHFKFYSATSILAISALGEGVGNSLCQAGMLVSGLWGIFYFNEVTEMNNIVKWMGAALVTVGGILLLSVEHVRG